jgi:hypothetical protein
VDGVQGIFSETGHGGIYSDLFGITGRSGINDLSNIAWGMGCCVFLGCLENIKIDQGWGLGLLGTTLLSFVVT